MGAPIPPIPGSGLAMPSVPAAPSYSTNFLTETASNLDAVRQSSSNALNKIGTNSTAYVWLGSQHAPNPTEQPGGDWHRFKSLDEMGSEFEAMSVEKKRRMAKLLYLGGYLSDENATLLDVTNAYGKLLGDAAVRFAGGQNISPDQLLEMNIRYNTGNEKFDLNQKDLSSLTLVGQAPKGPHTTTTTQKTVDIWNATDARGLARQTMQQALGRDPTEAEYQDFVSALQSAQRANPTTQTTTTNYDAQGNATTQSVQNSGGMNDQGIQQIAQTQAESNPGYAEWQAVGTYFPALLQALGSAVPGT